MDYRSVGQGRRDDHTGWLHGEDSTLAGAAQEHHQAAGSFPIVTFRTGKRWRVGWFEVGPKGERVTRSKLFDQKRGPGGAEEFQASLEEDIRVGRYLKQEDRERRFSEVAELWLESKRKIKRSTRGHDTRWLNNYILPRWGGVRIDQIKRIEIEKWVTALEAGTAIVAFETRNTDTAGPLSAPTIKLIVESIFGAVLRFAVSHRWIYENPLARVELPSIMPIRRRSTLTHAQVELMANACQEVSGEYRDYVVV